MTLRRLGTVVAVVLVTAGAVAIGLEMRNSAGTAETDDDFFVPISRGLLEGGPNQQQTWSRSYYFQNSWQDFSANGGSLIHAYAGALAAKPCTGVLVIERLRWPNRVAIPEERLTVLRFPGIGPVRVVSSVGTTVRLASAEGDRGVLLAETGSVTWRAPHNRRDLSEARCGAM